METKFNLSEKRYSSDEGIDNDGNIRNLTWHYQEEEVKEAIKILKSEIPDEVNNGKQNYHDKINKIFGNNLC